MKRLIFVLALPPCRSMRSRSFRPRNPPSAADRAAPATGPLATVNGVAIPRQRLDLVLRQQTARGAADNEQLRAQLREALINNELLFQEGNRNGMAKKPEVQQQIELSRQEVIANAVVNEFLRTNPVSDADVQKEYDRAKAQTGEREYHARHILVANEADAKTRARRPEEGRASSTKSRRRNRSTKARGPRAATWTGTCPATSTRRSPMRW